jgi:hypothetical protein
MIIEAILTSIAWRKGWGPVALLPLAFAILLGLIGGAEHSLAIGLFGDVVCYVALISMIVKARKKADNAAAPAVATPTPEPSAFGHRDAA